VVRDRVAPRRSSSIEVEQPGGLAGLRGLLGDLGRDFGGSDGHHHRNVGVTPGAAGLLDQVQNPRSRLDQLTFDAFELRIAGFETLASQRVLERRDLRRRGGEALGR